MRIVHLTFTFRQGGIPALLVDITNEQVKADPTNIVVINNQIHEEMLVEVNPDVKVYKINRSEGNKNPYYALKLNYILWRLKPDIIHCHGEKCIEYLLPLFRKKAVLTVHDTLKLNPLYYSKYKKLYAISKTVQQDVLSHFELKSEIVYNGIQTNKIIIKTKIKKAQQDVFKMIQIGRLVTDIKGQHLSIEVIKILVYKYKITNIHLDFIGWGKDYDQLIKIIQEFNLENNISFLGLKDRPYIYSNLCEYDLMVHPSLYEGFGLNIVEAMAAKVPVLVSDTEGPMEVIENGKFGYFFKTGNVNDFTEKLIQILNKSNTEFQDELIENAYYHVVNNFDIKDTAQGYVKEYKMLTEKAD
ncbi:MAG: glycosyltransferase family 4 protein [Prolixibacteraceae bacterium]